ncbi:sulfatase [Haloferax sp. YSSS75]|uniref:sulfatase family protein n=1 Tax=Haloferax sp. YSSS75 TaxID=3388564 RepID=UPI00398D3A0C
MQDNQPNILFFLTDQHRFDWLGSNPEVPVRTPNIERLEKQGVRFDNALCPAPLCAPSRACLASGYQYERAGVPHNAVDFPENQTTYYQLLRDEGNYHVMGCGKFDLHKSTPKWGTDGQRCLSEWGFSAGTDNAGKWDAVISGAEEPQDPYMAFLHRNGLAETHVADMRRRRDEGAFRATFPTPLPPEAYCDNWIAQKGLSLLSDAPSGSPWHLVVNFAGPHDPLDVTEEMHGWYRDPDVDFPEPTKAGDELTPDEHADARRNYAAMIENIDNWIGKYLEVLEERNERQETIVVFSSDHGEMLGDHGEWRKRSPYHPSVAIPLVIDDPRMRPQEPSDALVGLHDLFATFLQQANVSIPDDTDSRSLVDILRGKKESHRKHIRTALGNWEAVFDGRYKFVRGYDDLSQDTDGVLLDTLNGEKQDVSNTHPDIKQHLKEVCDSGRQL